MNRVEIFKPGKHTASDGRVFTFTEAQLRDAAAAYKPDLHEAPIVVGHPIASGAPAYGWVKSLAFDDGAKSLVAELQQVEPQFEEGVKAGRWKKRSAAFYLPDDPDNPTPGNLYVHHVAFLGAKAPAVKGLRDVQFNAAGKGIVEFSDWQQMTVASLFRKLKNFLIDQFGQDKADAVMPEYELESVARQPEVLASYQEQPQETTDVLTKEEIERQEKALKAEKEAHDRRVAEFAEREKAFNVSQSAAAQAAALAASGTFVDGLVRDGKVLPAQRDGLVAFMAALPAAGIVEFGEGDKKVKKPSAEWLQSYLKAQPKVIEFGEHGHRGLQPTHETDPVKAANDIARKAIEFQESEKKLGRVVSIDAAVTHITSQGEQR